MPKVRDLVSEWSFAVDFAALTAMDTAVGKVEETIQRATTTALGFAERIGDTGRRLSFSLTLPAAGVTAGLLAAGSAAEETDNKFRTVFGNLATDVDAFVQSTADGLGRSETSLRDFLSQLQDTFVPLGFARDSAADMSKTLVQLAVDVASFNNKSEPDVVRDFQSAIVGNTETVRKYGIVISQARLDQELLNSGIAGGAKDATEAQKAQARLNLIVAGSADAIGDAARTAGGFANVMRRVTSVTRRLFENFGSIILPIASKLGQAMATVINEIASLPRPMKIAILVLGGLLGVIGPLLIAISIFISLIIKVTISTFIWKGAVFAATFVMKGLTLAMNLGGAAILKMALKFIAAKALIVGSLLAVAAIFFLVFEDIASFIDGDDSLVGMMSAWVERNFTDPLANSIGAMLFTDQVGWEEGWLRLFQGTSLVAVVQRWIFDNITEPVGNAIVDAFEFWGRLIDKGIEGFTSATDFSDLLIRFFGPGGGAAGASAADQIAQRPESVFPAPTTPFATPSGANVTQRNITVDANVTMQVPDGTPASQREFIRQEGRAVVREEFEQMLRQAESAFPPPGQ